MASTRKSAVSSFKRKPGQDQLVIVAVQNVQTVTAFALPVRHIAAQTGTRDAIPETWPNKKEFVALRPQAPTKAGDGATFPSLPWCALDAHKAP
jgi:hypothetical protein